MWVGEKASILWIDLTDWYRWGFRWFFMIIYTFLRLNGLTIFKFFRRSKLTSNTRRNVRFLETKQIYLRQRNILISSAIIIVFCTSITLSIGFHTNLTWEKLFFVYLNVIRIFIKSGFPFESSLNRDLNFVLVRLVRLKKILKKFNWRMTFLLHINKI